VQYTVSHLGEASRVGRIPHWSKEGRGHVCIVCMNQPFATEEGDVPEGTLALVISRTVGEGIHEDLDITNYGLSPVRFNLEPV
jgi:hypothetical protein